MRDLSLHILDVVENATAAEAKLVEIIIEEDTTADLLTLTVRDDGRGMDKEMLERARDPFVTTRTTRRVGLGIAMLEQAAREAGGGLELASTPGKGTTVTATFTASHIDRKPFGDLGSTLVSLILGSPEVEFRFESNVGGEDTVVDTREVKEQLDGVSISDPAVLRLIREAVGG